MVRGGGGAASNSTRSPHTRGDGPAAKTCGRECGTFSPHAWGWSVDGAPRLRPKRVLPTRVGMVRPCGAGPRQQKRSPHTRGDGPVQKALTSGNLTFSPHAWGWSGRASGLLYSLFVLPTRVGMVRTWGQRPPQDCSSPHTRGDGPRSVHAWVRVDAFSPHAWGWSAVRAPLPWLRPVLPTRVGMVRRVDSQQFAGDRSPHTRGDGPQKDF